MLGTLSEPHRGQMSHICDIRALRVNEYTSAPEPTAINVHVVCINYSIQL